MRQVTPGCIALFALVLTGCATRLHSLPPDLSSVSGDETIVMGRVESHRGSIPYARVDFFDRLNPLIMSVRNNATGKVYDIVCDRNVRDFAQFTTADSFCVALPPGLYYVTRLRLGEDRPVGPYGHPEPPIWQMSLHGRGRRSYDDLEGRDPIFRLAPVPAGSPPPVVYIGTLEISFQLPEVKAGYDFLGFYHEASPYNRGWDVRDDLEGAAKAFHAKYPQATQAITKSLMTN